MQTVGTWSNLIETKVSAKFYFGITRGLWPISPSNNQQPLANQSGKTFSLPTCGCKDFRLVQMEQAGKQNLSWDFVSLKNGFGGAVNNTWSKN